MPPSDAEALITFGPFEGLDTRTADAFEKANFATLNSNVDTARKLGALSSARGRSVCGAFPMLGSSNSVGSLARYDVGPELTYYIACGTNPTPAGNFLTGFFTPQNTASIGTLGNITTQWYRAVQSNGVMFLDNGFQIYYTQGLTLGSAYWQYPSPTGFMAYAFTDAASNMAAATYSYAFVTVVAIPTYGGTTYQQTSPFYLSTNTQYITDQYGNVTYQPGTLVLNSSGQGIKLAGPFSGNTPDGLPYKTDIYRMSSNTNVFQRLAAGVSGTTFTDTFNDSAIAANQQLVLNRDPPPTGILDIGPGGVVTNNLNPIESMNNRMWVMAREQNPNTYNVPETQIWYSEVGQPWSFDGALGVLESNNEYTTLIGNETYPVGLEYGDQPVGIAALGSQIFAFGRSSVAEVYGTDETNFISLPLFRTIGCVAPLSLTKLTETSLAWLAATGAYVYNQLQLVNVSDERMRNYLSTIPAAHWYAAVGFVRRTKWFISFPLDNVTLTYDVPTKAWNILPYATPAATYYPSIGQDPGGQRFEQIVAARTGTVYVDYWDDTDSDLGNPISLSWTSPIVTGNPEEQKTYRSLAILAPPQPTIVTVTVAPDPGFPTSPPAWTSEPINLALSPMSKICNISQLGCKGYSAQVTINATNTGASPIEIWEVKIGGTIDRTWAVNG